MESSLQSNRQGRPRRGSEHHVPPHSIILVRCIVYIILHMLSYTMACTSCLQAYKHDFRREQPQPRVSCLGPSLRWLPWVPCIFRRLGCRPRPNPTHREQHRPAAAAKWAWGQRYSRPETGRRRLSAAAGGQSCRPALLSRHHDISLRRGQRPRHRRKQPSQDRA